MATKFKFATPEFSLMVLGAKDYDYHYRNAISYANYEIDIKKIMKATKSWVVNNTDYDMKVMFSLSDVNFSSIGKFCYIMEKGGQFDEKHMLSIHKQLEIIYAKAQGKYEANKASKEESEEEVPKKRVGVQEYMRDRAAEVATELDVMVDDYLDDTKAHPLKNVDLAKFFKSQAQELKSGHYKYLAEFYISEIAELEEVLEGKDDDLAYSWKSRKKSEIRELLAFYQNITDVAAELKTKTASTTTRKKKPMDKAKKVSKMTYAEKCTIAKVESINPIHVIGAQSLWVYNIKTRKLGRYVAIDGDGLDISGTSIKNFNSTSVEGIVMKTADINLSKFHTLSEKVRNKRFDALKSMKINLKGRINEHVILICVEK